MAYFPAFIKLDDMDILIVGGGYIASEKLIHLLEFTTKIKVLAPYLSSDMKQLIDKNNLSYDKRVYQKKDINNFGVVIVAIDDISLQEEIYNEAKLLPNCLVNSVDSVKYCDFIFPSYIKKDDLTIAISTAGSSPAIAKYLRIYLQNLIPDTIGSFLKQMKEYRTIIPKGKKRMKFLDKKAKQYISTWSNDEI